MDSHYQFTGEKADENYIVEFLKESRLSGAQVSFVKPVLVKNDNGTTSLVFDYCFHKLPDGVEEVVEIDNETVDYLGDILVDIIEKSLASNGKTEGRQGERATTE